MKKLILSLIVAAAFSATSFAQFNLKAGLNFANQSFEATGFSLDPDMKISFLVGANYNVKLSESLGFRPGAQLSFKGSKFDFGGFGSATNSFTYIEVPLDFTYSFSGVTVHAGPYLGLLLSAKAQDDDVKEFIKPLDFGVNVGAGYNFGKIGVGVNYGLGLANIDDEQDEDGSIKNRVISLYVTYSL